MFKKLRKNKKGFTLVELIVVIAILGILAAIAIPRFAGTLNNSKLKADQATAKVIQSAVRVYEADTGNLPPESSLANFISVMGTFIDGGAIPNPQSTGYEFYYEETDGKVTLANSAVSGALQISP